MYVTVQRAHLLIREKGRKSQEMRTTKKMLALTREQRQEDAEGGNKKKNEPNTSRTPAVAINSDVFISRSDVNPELIYKKVKCLGTGAFGEVWLVRHKDLNKEFAMKIIHKKTHKPSEEKEIQNEIKILKTLDHPKILKIIDFFSTSTMYYIITEYCPLGELFHEIEKVGKFEEGPASFIMNQLFRAPRFKTRKHNDIRKRSE